MTDTIVLGLDGATWDVLDPLIEAGRLPNIERVRQAGHDGTLESTFPPITAPAWLSMATGRNPGKTGVFYFLNRDDPDSFDFHPLDSTAFQGLSFWDVLDARDQSVGILNYPMLFPPYEIDGFMVSGMGSEAGESITYPESLGDDLDAATGGYEVKVPYADPKYRDRPERLKTDLLGVIDTRERAIEYLLTERDPDHFFGIVSATDWAQHYFWRYHDDSHPLYESGTGHDETLAGIWERVDEVVGTVADHAREEDATLFLVSDHGFGPVRNTFYSNAWLEREGYLTEADQSLPDRLRTAYFPYLRRVGEAVVSLVPPLNDFARSVGESVRKPPGEGVDFEESVAFAPRQNLTTGMLYLLAADESDKRALKRDLQALEDQAGAPDSVTIYEPADVYHGPKTDLAPDLMLQFDDFECAVDPRPKPGDGVRSRGPPSAARSGGHNRQGIVVAAGPSVESGTGLQASIYDIAPTLLALHGTPIPNGVDGAVLDTILRDGALSDRPARVPIDDLVGTTAGPGRDDEEAVQDRLEDLGYL